MFVQKKLNLISFNFHVNKLFSLQGGTKANPPVFVCAMPGCVCVCVNVCLVEDQMPSHE